MKTPRPLDDLEMHEVLRLTYPEHISDDEDHYFELSQDACEQTINLGDGFETTLAELLGRVVMLASPMQSALTGEFSHCLGEITINNGSVKMVAVVRRSVVA